LHSGTVALFLCFYAVWQRNCLIMSWFEGAAQLDSQKKALSRAGILRIASRPDIPLPSDCAPSRGYSRQSNQASVIPPMSENLNTLTGSVQALVYFEAGLRHPQLGGDFHKTGLRKICIEDSASCWMTASTILL
jgi:hypothetical protein